MIIGSVALSYEQACDIAGVPYDRGYVTLSEVTDKLSEITGLDLLGSEQIGWVENNEITGLDLLGSEQIEWVENCEQSIKHF